MSDDARARLGALQRALAAALYEPGARQRLRDDPDAFLAPFGLTPENAALLRSIEPARLDRFHEMQARDRAYFTRALFPLSVAYHGEGVVEAYRAAQPYGHDDYAVEAARFEAFARARWPRDGAARDLAAYEAALVALRALAPRAPGSAPRAGARVALAPTARLLATSVDLAALVESLQAGEPALVAPRVGHSLLVRAPDGVVSTALDADDAAFVRRFRVGAPVPEGEDRARFDELWRAGALALVE